MGHPLTHICLCPPNFFMLVINLFHNVLNPNWVHINSFNLLNTHGAYADIRDVDLGSHAP
jgi:hypothetical protein